MKPTVEEAEAARAMAEAKLVNPLSGGLFPWERGAFGDRTAPLAWWQKAYWLAFGVVLTSWLAERAYNKATTGLWRGNEPLPAARVKENPRPTLMKSRVQEALNGGSFVEDSDPFEGLSPQEIEKIVAEQGGKSRDPWEGSE